MAALSSVSASETCMKRTVSPKPVASDTNVLYRWWLHIGGLSKSTNDRINVFSHHRELYLLNYWYTQVGFKIKYSMINSCFIWLAWCEGTYLKIYTCWIKCIWIVALLQIDIFESCYLLFIIEKFWQNLLRLQILNYVMTEWRFKKKILTISI